jgi:hypothetical protein
MAAIILWLTGLGALLGEKLFQQTNWRRVCNQGVEGSGSEELGKHSERLRLRHIRRVHGPRLCGAWVADVV